MIRNPNITLDALEDRRLFATGISGTEVLASFTGKNGLAVVADYLKKNPKAPLAGYVSLKHSKQLFAAGGMATVQLRLAKGVTPAGAIKLIAKVPGARWASPNYLYAKGGGEAVPTDPKWTSQGDALKQINLPTAWDNAKADTTLVVAVIDDGFDATHEDLQGIRWTNKGEIPGNGKDDDNNGYVDDVNGWDFGSGDNNTAPAYDATYNLTESHGTQVASIIGANANNGVGITGVAAGVKIMPVRFRGADVVVTSAGIASSVAYAANNGAKIINLSYSFDPYMNDPAFYAAVDLAHSKGVLWVNSSGNNNVANPPRTTIDKILFVNNVDSNDVRNTSSNYGTATDLSAPGTDVMAAAPGNQYYPVSGTSFASAVTSGIAALVWSKYPTWTRDQVAARLLGTADTIDAKNPGFAGLLGAGRVNAAAAVNGPMAGPKIRGLVGIAGGATVATAPSSLSVGTLSVLDAKTLTSGAFELRSAGADNQFDTADDSVIPLTIAGTYAYGSNKIDLTPGKTLGNGTYRFTARTSIADAFGSTLATPYVTTFSVAPGAPVTPSNLAAATPATAPTEAVLTWTDKSDNETGFLIERSSTSTFDVIDKTYTAAANSTRYNDWGLTQGGTYYYRIRAVNAQGGSANSNTAELKLALPPSGAPVAPSNVTVAAGGSATEAALRWTDNATNETGFVIQRSTSATFATIDKTINAIAGSNQYWDWGLATGTTYYYRVQAVNGADASAWSATVSYNPGGTATPTTPMTPTTPTTPTPPATAPVAPSALTLTATAGKVALAWKDNSTNETKFEIQRSLLSNFSFLTSTVVTAAGVKAYTDTGVSSGWTYYYRVRAVNAVGASAWTIVASVKAK